MSLFGLPDFQHPIQGDGWQVFYAYEEPGRGLLSPARLEVATRTDGRPDFLLQLVRGQNPALPPAPYGVVDFGISPQYAFAAALPLLREQRADARLELAPFVGGFLRLYPLGEFADFPALLRQPIALDWNGLFTGRYILRMPLDAALVLRRALVEEALALFAQAEMAIEGVAPRLAVQVRFDPGKLLSALLQRADADQRVASDEVFDFFSADVTTLGVTVEGALPAPREFAEVMTDWICARFGTLVAAPREDGRAYLSLALPAVAEGGRFTWDLSQPLRTWRPFVLGLHPLESARQIIKAGEIDTIIPPPVIVPPLPNGSHRIAVSASIPEQLHGVVSLGVSVQVPPRPPHRPQAIHRSVDLASPRTGATVTLQLSPTEPLAYTYRTSVLVRASNGIRQLEGPPKDGNTDRLTLTADDFPVQFIPLEASQALRELATIHGRYRWKDAEAPVEVALTLDQHTPALAVALPRSVQDATFEIEAQPHQGGPVLRLGPWPARRYALGLPSFREYGPHRVAIDVLFDDASTLLALDFLPEFSPETPDTISVLAFTPTQPHKEWGYLATSPFRAGYRYRRHASSDSTPSPWSHVCSPFVALALTASTLTGGTRKGESTDRREPMLDDTEHVVIDGLELTPKDDSKRVWTYVPLHPTLEHNQSGRPMLQVIEAGATAFLQCTARVALNEDTRATLLARLREKKPQAEAIESALLSVEQITLEAKTDNEWVVIAHSKGSGISPWTAAFAATLAAGPLSAIKAAVAGQKDHARLKALIVLPGSPAALVRTESTTDSHTETASGTASTSFTTQTETTSSAKAATRRELTTDLAECFSQSS